VRPLNPFNRPVDNWLTQIGYAGIIPSLRGGGVTSLAALASLSLPQILNLNLPIDASDAQRLFVTVAAIKPLLPPLPFEQTPPSLSTRSIPHSGVFGGGGLAPLRDAEERRPSPPSSVSSRDAEGKGGGLISAATTAPLAQAATKRSEGGSERSHRSRVENEKTPTSAKEVPQPPVHVDPKGHISNSA
jgi:hypothetical protein